MINTKNFVNESRAKGGEEFEYASRHAKRNGDGAERGGMR